MHDVPIVEIIDHLHQVQSYHIAKRTAITFINNSLKNAHPSEINGDFGRKSQLFHSRFFSTTLRCFPLELGNVGGTQKWNDHDAPIRPSKSVCIHVDTIPALYRRTDVWTDGIDKTISRRMHSMLTRDTNVTTTGT